jgi:hypothetical protein
MKKNSIWIIGIILTASAGFLMLQTGIPSNQKNSFSGATTTVPADKPIPIIETVSPTYEPCAFVWANHDSPELTGKLNTALHQLDPKAEGNAGLFGEDCVYADRHATFSTMETDFYVFLPVDDIKDQEKFGNWMAQVLTFIVSIPRQEIPGNYGFVEFWFTKGDADKVNIRVPIQKYLEEAQGITGKKLFNIFLDPTVTPVPP